MTEINETAKPVKYSASVYDHVYEKNLTTTAIESTLQTISRNLLCWCNAATLKSASAFIRKIKDLHGSPNFMLTLDNRDQNELRYYAALIGVGLTEHGNFSFTIDLRHHRRNLAPLIGEKLWHDDGVTFTLEELEDFYILDAVGSCFNPTVFRSDTFTNFIDLVSKELGEFISSLSQYDYMLDTDDNEKEFLHLIFNSLSGNRTDSETSARKMSPWIFLGWDYKIDNKTLVKSYIATDNY